MLFSCLARRRCARALLIVLGGWATVATAQSIRLPLTLDAAVRQGVTRAPLLAARDAEVGATRDEAMRAGRLPDPSLTFGVSNYPVTDPGAFSLRSDTMTMRTIGVMQTIPSHAARAADRSLAAAQVDAAEADRTATAQDVRERIADAWIGVWAAAQQRTLLEALRDESTLAVQVAKARLHGGTGSAADVLAAQAEALTLANRIEASDADLQVANASLQRWLGDAPTALADAPDFGQLPVAPDQLEQHTDRQAPMQAWQARERVADAALAQARASKHPDWSVDVTYGHRAPYLSDMVMVQVGVSLPLFTRNRQDRAISAKQAQRDAVESAHEDARRAQRETVARDVAVWQGWGRQIVRDRNDLLPLARDRSRVALAAYRGGGTLQPWLDARRDEIALHLDYANALATRAHAWAALAYLLPESTPSSENLP
ncbi:TolC family protein [Fulvimonas sp. R45]|nr:TolC family protein [Fulvimonas sp. R45]MDO1530562.1 TolC family protein [Fulvimonas sp. R45]